MLYPEETIELSGLVHDPGCPALGEGGSLVDGYARCPGCGSDSQGPCGPPHCSRWPVPPPPPFAVPRTAPRRSVQERPPLAPLATSRSEATDVNTNMWHRKHKGRRQASMSASALSPPGETAALLRVLPFSPLVVGPGGHCCFTSTSGPVGEQFLFVPGGAASPQRTGRAESIRDPGLPHSQSQSRSPSSRRSLEPRSPAVLVPCLFEQSASTAYHGFRLGTRGSLAEQSLQDVLACTARAPKGFMNLALGSGQLTSQSEAPRPDIKRRPRHPDMNSVSGQWVHGVVLGALYEAYEQLAPAAHVGWWWPLAITVREQVAVIVRELATPAQPGGAAAATTLQAVRSAVADAMAAVAPLTRSLLQCSLSTVCSKAAWTAGQGDQGAGGDWGASLAVHLCSDPGDRSYMEDRAICLPAAAFMNVPPEGPCELYVGVYDGHAGVDAAEWARDRLHSALFAHAQYNTSPGHALRDAIQEVDRGFAEWAAEREVDSGACVLAAVLKPAARELWTAWLGDCTAFLLRSGPQGTVSTVTLTEPHCVPDNEAEAKAVVARGGRLLHGLGGQRVEGVIQITRSIGDRQVRHALSQEPQIFCTPITDKDEFIILGSDGLIEEMAPTEVCDFVFRIKGTVDRWHDMQRKLIELWDHAGNPTQCAHSRSTGSAGRSVLDHTIKASSMSSRVSRASKAVSSVSGLAQPLSALGPPATRAFGVFSDEDLVVLPPRLKSAHALMQKLVDALAVLIECISVYEPTVLGTLPDGSTCARSTSTRVPTAATPQPTEHPVPADVLREMLEIAFAPEFAPFDSYQVLVDVLVAEAFVQKGSGRDNTTAVVIFLKCNVLSDPEVRLRNILRGE
eukprot:TRINITY_DN3786_c0_g1_i1.p1 TRINITY_DN3786_c0_g1~~TRINITY_DN3786_c0_g1_i1.p1  ORF type:complete len:877 (+),score=216.95 TRINITY_DN3786_c0_g1_i1:81-2633(+)